MDGGSLSFRPPPYVNRWVNQGSRSLDSVEDIEMNQFPSIFRLPREIIQTQPKAYTPHFIGLGPYNHFRHEFLVTDRFKRARLKEFIKKNSRKFAGDIVEIMKKLEVAVRASYGEYLDLMPSTLAYIMAIDAFFLISYLLRKTEEADESDGKFITRLHGEFSKDVLMLENQIPAETIAQMGKELGVLPNTKDTKLYGALFYDFCTAHSPLKLSEEADHRNYKSTHLLAHMYNLIVQNRGVKASDDGLESEEGEPMAWFVEDLRPLLTLALQSLTPIVQQNFYLSFIARVVHVFTQVVSLANFISKRETQIEFQIPSASTLSEKLKLDFRLTEGGIRYIKFQDGELPEIKKKRKTSALYLPVITLGHGSEVILRNLVAYEAAAIATQEHKLELTHYVNLMCGIIDTAKDVQLLREKGIIIIKGNLLSDEEVAEMFNGISSCLGGPKSTEESESLIAAKGVKDMVENNQVWRRVYKYCFQKISLNTVMNVVYSYVAVQVVLEMVNKYCELYGCSQTVVQITSIVNWISNYVFSS